MYCWWHFSFSIESVYCIFPPVFFSVICRSRFFFRSLQYPPLLKHVFLVIYSFHDFHFKKTHTFFLKKLGALNFALSFHYDLIFMLHRSHFFAAFWYLKICLSTLNLHHTMQNMQFHISVNVWDDNTLPLHAISLILLSLAEVRLSPTLTLSPLMIWYSGQTVLFLFLLAKAALAFLPKGVG